MQVLSTQRVGQRHRDPTLSECRQPRPDSCGSRSSCSRSRPPALLAGFLLVILLAPALPAASQSWADRDATPAALTRLRTYDLTVARTIRRAYDLSPTFRQLVETITQSDLIVYLVRNNRFSRLEAGRLMFSGEAGGQRYVQIQLSTRLNDRELIILIAHELTHAVEVAQAADVVDVKSLRDFYTRIGDGRSHGFDTAAARKVAGVVDEEIWHNPDR